MTLMPDSNDLAMLSNLPAGGADTGLPEDNSAEIDFQFPEHTEQQARPAQPDAPQAAPQAEPAQPTPDIQREILTTLQAMRQPQQQQQDPQQYAQQQWVDPAMRTENAQQARELLSRASYDEEAANQYGNLQAQWSQERLNHEMGQRFGAFQQQQTLMMQAPAVQAQAFSQVQPQYGQGLSREVFDGVIAEVFPDPAQRTAALNPQFNPQAPALLAMIADAAYGRSMRMNPAPAHSAQTAPASVRSDARNPAPSRAGSTPWEDNSYVDDVIQQAMHNPFKFSRGGNQ